MLAKGRVVAVRCQRQGRVVVVRCQRQGRVVVVQCRRLSCVVVVWCQRTCLRQQYGASDVSRGWLLYKQEESQVSRLVSRIWLLYKQEKSWLKRRRIQNLGQQYGASVWCLVVVVRYYNRIRVQGAQLYLVVIVRQQYVLVIGSRSRGRSSTQLGSSIVLAAGLGFSGSGRSSRSSGSGTRGQTRKKTEKKSGLDTSKTLRRETAIALRYC